MKIKIFFLILTCSFFGILINKQNTLIKVPKDERSLIKVSNEIIKGKVIYINDGDSFTLEDNTKIRLFGIDAPELLQTCVLTIENLEKNVSETTTINTANIKKNTSPNIAKKDTDVKSEETKAILNIEEIKCGENAKNKLTELIKNRTVSCLIKGKDSYDRMVSECYFEVPNRITKKNNRININKEMVSSGNAVAFLQFSDKYVDDENKAKQENRGIWATTFDLPSVYRRKNIR